MRNFSSPELTGLSGERIEVPDALAIRLRDYAVDDQPGGNQPYEELEPGLLEAIRRHAIQIAGKDVEHSVVLAADGSLIRKGSGTRTQVSLPIHVLQQSVMVHNHPESTPLSLDDLEALFVTGLESVWAVGGDWLYGASLGSCGAGMSSLADLKLRSEYLHRMTFAVIVNAYQRNDLPGVTESEREIAHQHALLSELAREGFVRYGRYRYAT